MTEDPARTDVEIVPPALQTGTRFEPPVVETPCGDPSCEICRPAP
jgi:hypothetical protein